MNHIRLLVRNQCGSHIIHGLPNPLAFQQNYSCYDGPSESGIFSPIDEPLLTSYLRNFCNFWNSRQKFEIPAMLQGGTICLVSPVKNSELSNKNCRRSSVFKKSGISAISGILSRNLKLWLCYRVALYA